MRAHSKAQFGYNRVHFHTHIHTDNLKIQTKNGLWVPENVKKSVKIHAYIHIYRCLHMESF